MSTREGAACSVRRCRGHWHVTTLFDGDEEDLCFAGHGDQFATPEEAQAVADRLNRGESAFPPASPPSPAAAPAEWNLDEWLTRETQHSSDCTANERRVGYNADCICGAWRFVALAESRRTLQGELEEMRAGTALLDYLGYLEADEWATIYRQMTTSGESIRVILARYRDKEKAIAALSPKDGDPT